MGLSQVRFSQGESPNNASVSQPCHASRAVTPPSQAKKRPSADPKYLETIENRATAALLAANVQDDAKKLAAIKVVEAHYIGINDIHFDRDVAVKAAGSDKAALARVLERAAADVAVVHNKFTQNLAALLTPEQCDGVKDKMTYGVLLLTFQVYCEMLPKLTDQEKATIREHLLAGREAALVAGDANEKHEQFRLAKGKIVNFLSKQGYDLKKAEAEWNERRKKDPANNDKK